jgi:hypothetical protein
VLVMAGNIKREKIQNDTQNEDEQEVNILITNEQQKFFFFFRLLYKQLWIVLFRDLLLMI